MSLPKHAFVSPCPQGKDGLCHLGDAFRLRFVVRVPPHFACRIKAIGGMVAAGNQERAGRAVAASTPI